MTHPRNQFLGAIKVNTDVQKKKKRLLIVV